MHKLTSYVDANLRELTLMKTSNDDLRHVDVKKSQLMSIDVI